MSISVGLDDCQDFTLWRKESSDLPEIVGEGGETDRSNGGGEGGAF